MVFSENGLNTMVFPSLKRFEAKVVAMTVDLLGGDEETVGNMTSGGRGHSDGGLDRPPWARARKPTDAEPEMILPATAHPAFEKAAHCFDVRPVRIPVRAGL